MTSRWDETWHRLRGWTDGQGRAERLAVQVLLADGFVNPDPSHPLGGADGGADALVRREGAVWVMAAYFPRGQQTFATIKRKLLGDLDGVARNGAHGIVFVSNQELRRAEREALTALSDVPIALYHLERIVAILDQPEMYGVRDQFLKIRPPTAQLQPVPASAGDHARHRAPHLVRRDALWEEAARQEVPGQPLALYGDAGNGKTQLALALAADRGEQRPVALIRAGSRSSGQGVYEFDLLSTLLAAGYEAQGWTQPALELGIRELLGRDDGPAVVLDDLRLDVLSRLVPERCAVPVYITSRSRVPLGRPLHVAGFDDDQAVSAASRILPEADEKDLRHLCQLVGSSPQAINVACRVVSRGSIPLAELIECLKAEPLGTLDDMEAIIGEREVPGTPGLVAVHRELLRQVAAIQDGLTTLRRLVWFTGEPVSVQTAYAMAGPADGIGAGLRFDGVLTQLASLGALVHDDGVVSVNDLSRIILRSLTLPALDSEADAFIERLRAAAPMARLPTPPAHRVSGDRWSSGKVERAFLGLELVGTEEYLAAFTGRPTFCCLCLDTVTWLLHQADVAVFAPAAPSASVILNVTHESFFLWAGGQDARRTCTDHEAVLIFAVMQLYQELQQAQFTAMLPDGETLDGQSRPSGEPDETVWSWLAAGEQHVKHTYLGLSVETVRDHGAPALTSCGRLVVPACGDALPDCGDCIADQSSQQRSSLLRWASLMREIAPGIGGMRPEVIAMLGLHAGVTESQLGNTSDASYTWHAAARDLLALAEVRPLAQIERKLLALLAFRLEKAMRPGLPLVESASARSSTEKVPPTRSG